MRNDMTWVRPLDPARLLESRRGGAPGHIVLEVADPDGYANGRFEWTASPEGLECRPSTASADLALSAAMLGAASLGGTSLLTPGPSRSHRGARPRCRGPGGGDARLGGAPLDQPLVLDPEETQVSPADPRSRDMPWRNSFGRNSCRLCND
jgi:hypothetical protein